MEISEVEHSDVLMTSQKGVLLSMKTGISITIIYTIIKLKTVNYRSLLILLYKLPIISKDCVFTIVNKD